MRATSFDEARNAEDDSSSRRLSLETCIDGSASGHRLITALVVESTSLVSP
jgi:hypothetical protein